MLTADTITDAQIRALLEKLRYQHDGSPEGRDSIRACLAALAVEVVLSKWTRETARAHCADILNTLQAALLTADTISDKQIVNAMQRGIIPAALAVETGANLPCGRWYAPLAVRKAARAICAEINPGVSGKTRRFARARCAEILNARQEAK